ncbi:MAG: hypothetical protein RL266_225 [Bacteroidota bacterium]|jgi:hypothetical protein
MVKRVLKTTSVVILSLALLSVFGFFIQQKTNALIPDGPLKEFVMFPQTVMDVFQSNEIRNIPPTFEMRHFFDPINNLRQDIFGLNAFYNPDEGTWEVRLFNFKDDSVAHTWKLNRSTFNQTDRLYPNSEPRNPILLPNRNVIVDNDETFNLYRLDAESNIVWHNTELIFHHSMNLDHDGNIWVCTTEPRLIKVPTDEHPVAYEDDYLTKVDVETGSVIYHKSTSELLIENGYRNFVYGFSHVIDGALDEDPLHLNDIEPVLNDGPYWKKGDVFLSFRHRSLVLLYRPSSNKIIRLIYGPFLRQHDIDILNDSTISIFNNEGTSVGKKLKQDHELFDHPPADVIDFSNIMHYHFADSSFSHHLKHQFDEHHIFTDTQGFHQYLSNGMVYVEQHGRGIMYFMDENQVYYKNQGSNWVRDFVERPHWVRIYENVDL